MDSQDYLALILYYGRTRFYHSMQKLALDGLAKFPNQTLFRIYFAFGLTLGGNRVQESIRELNPLKNDTEFGLAAILGLLYSHKRCSIVDNEALKSLEQKFREERNVANPNAYYYAASFLFLTGRYEKSREFADKALKLDANFSLAIVLKAWADMALQKTTLSGSILHVFENALAQGKNIDATLGLVRFYQVRGEFDNAISALNKLSVRFPELSIPLIEKMDTELAAMDWDHALETASRIINLEPTNIAALRIKGILQLVRDGNTKGAAATLQQLLLATERVEVGNYELLLQICQLFSRNASRSREILSITERCIDKLTQFNPGTTDFLTEQGFHRLLLGKVKEAAISFRTATKIDESCYLAICGLTWCQILENGNAEQTRQQLEFLTELRNTEAAGGKDHPLLPYLCALFNDKTEKAIEQLIRSTELCMQAIESIPFGVEYFRILNPDFLMQICNELLRHSPIQLQVKMGMSFAQETATHVTLKQCINILDVVIRACPAHSQAIFIRAKVEFLGGDLSLAVANLQRLNDLDVANPDALLLLAQIQIQQQHYSNATQSLELALSHNFSVRENPMYWTLFGALQKERQQFSEAQKSFMAALQLVGSPFVGSTDNFVKEKITGSGNERIHSFTLGDKVTLYLELIETLGEMNSDPQSAYESERLLQFAMEEFGGTSEEGRLVIAKAELMVKSCNLAKAINLLNSIQPGKPYFVQAKTRLAEIYLKQKHDRVAFAKCFNELVEACPEAESYLILGEAYMSIQEPDLAVEAYQTAFNKQPNDSLLASRLGRAYVKTHQYRKAIKYYKEALKNPLFSRSNLMLDLAELFLKLKQYQDAIDTLSEDINDHRIEVEDVQSLQQRTKQLLLLARVHERSGHIANSLAVLQKARENQLRLQKRISVDQSGNIHEQNKVLFKICHLLAQQSVVMKENEQAIKYFKECLKYFPNDVETLTSLARLHMQMNSMDLCRDVCVLILEIDSDNEAASVIMADLSFRRMDFENASYHFSQLLVAQPCYWTALARFIEVMRRYGSLAEALNFIQRAENAVGTSHPAGLNYCKGLFEWYNGNPNTALRYFNMCRRDEEWGQQSLYNMIEICINPDGEVPVGGEILENNDSDDYNDSRIIAMRTAERLLKELRPRLGSVNNESLNHRLIHNFLQLATRQKFQIETALQEFTELATKEEYQNAVGPILGMASALVLLRQTQRAKNQLKRIARIPWNFEEAEYLERSWLLLADIYVNSNKFDVAEGFLSKALEHNKSCAKAYELLGYISEKAQNYREASKYYHNAWIYSGRSKPHIGYKLAYSYMKTKRFANAVDICQQVIKTHPDYTVIRKEILDKCRANLRP